MSTDRPFKVNLSDLINYWFINHCDVMEKCRILDGGRRGREEKSKKDMQHYVEEESEGGREENKKET